MKKRIFLILLCLCFLPGCTGQPQVQSITWLDVFDTVTTLKGYCSPEEFQETAQAVHEKLLYYHQLFDIYHEYPGMANLKTVNDHAGESPVAVDEALMELLLACREYYTLTQGQVNVAMGGVLSLWHDSREAALEHPETAALPDEAALLDAAGHISPDGLILDVQAGTVSLSDALECLDVGAVAKGWAGQQVRQLLPDGFLLDLGGNLVASSPKPDGSPWIVGIQSPFDSESYLRTLSLYSGAAVTSGDYQRYFEVQGVRYNHIISPDTLDCARLWRSVTVLHPDSALADCLSTALFLMDLDAGKALALRCGAQALWVDAAGNTEATDGFPEN